MGGDAQTPVARQIERRAGACNVATVRGLPVLVAVGLTLALFASARPAAAASNGAGLWIHNAPAPWVESNVTIDVRLGLAHGVVVQRFRNPGTRAAEAVYVFPLPTGAAVTAMRIEVGGERIDAMIAPRPTAQSTYEAAVQAGRAAALLERERPGVYTQSIAAVPGGGEVTITLEWRARLDRSGGAWELAHPMVVGPRYVPGAATGAPTRGGGTGVDTDRAPDASRVTPPVQRAATTPFSFVLRLDDAADVESPTHELAFEDAAGATPRPASEPGARTVRISDDRGNRELVVRWRNRSATGVRAIAEPDASGTGAYVAVLIESAAEIPRARTTPRSWLVAIDRSASLDGAAAAQARLVALGLIGELRDDDLIAVAAVGQRPRFVRATAAERARAGVAVDRLAKGTADLTAGLGATLAGLPRAPATSVVLITDGLVADDTAAIARAVAGGAVIHTVGVGAAPNRWLLEAIAARTGGTSHVVTGGDEAQTLAAALARAEAPLPITVDWKKPSVTEAEPQRPLVLAGGATLIVALDQKGVPDGEVEVAIGSRRLRAKIERVAGASLATEWARQRVGRLWAAGDHDAATRLAVERGIVSPTTALVAVGKVGGDAVRSTVTVPVPLPAGVRREALDRGGGDVDDRSADDKVVRKPDSGADAGGGVVVAKGSGSGATGSGGSGGGGGARGGGGGGGPGKLGGKAAPRPKTPVHKPLEEKKPEKETDRTARPDPRGGDTPPADGRDTAGAGTTAPTPDDVESTVTPEATGQDRDKDGVVVAEDIEPSFETDEELDANAAEDDAGRPRVGAAPEPTAPPPSADSGAEYYTEIVGTSSVRYRNAGGVLGRRSLTLGLALGARVDEGAPATIVSLGVSQPVTPRFAAGLRLDFGIAPTVDEPIVGSALLDISRSVARALELQLGAGLAWSGELGFGYRVGLGTTQGRFSIGLRLSGAITPETAPTTVGAGIDAFF